VELTGDLVPRRSTARGSPDFTMNDTSGVKSTGFWAREVQRDMRNPPRVLAGLGVAQGCARGGRGGFVRRCSPACVRACCKSGLRSTTSSTKGPGERADAHRGLGAADKAVQGGRRRWRAAEMGRRSWRGSRQGFSGLLGSMNRHGVVL
jgi:hypothetical protein